MPYNREAAVRYAHEWVYRRNPKYYDFSQIGGDCTNFISQALFAGGIPMDKKPDGWYYRSPDDRAPAWSSVSKLYEYGTRKKSNGMTLTEIPPAEIQIGDVIQLSFRQGEWGHSLLVVRAGDSPDESNVLIAAHSNDNDFRPLGSYVRAIAHRALRVGTA
ncbi:MAG: amidase domain-containing protein [Oscillospiraceae bacterium]|nr:amidase domain-containing protein [Oscillospiraceae bacterium]